VFADSEIVQLKMFEFSDTRQSQAVRSARQWAAINHQEFRCFLNCVYDGLNSTANPCEATHLRETKLVQSPSGVIGQFAGVRTTGAGEHTGQGGGFVSGEIGGVHRVKLSERRLRTAATKDGVNGLRSIPTQQPAWRWILVSEFSREIPSGLLPGVPT